MQDSTKSTLVLGTNSKKDIEKPTASNKEVEYKQVANTNDYIGELSDEQKEAEFHRQHEQYIKMKVERKKELVRLKKEQFGTSSSDSNDESSEEEIEEMNKIKKVQSKQSKGGKDLKKSVNLEKNSVLVNMELKKSQIETELLLSQQEFEINKKPISFNRLNKISLTKVNINGKVVHKMRIGLGGDEDVVFSIREPSEKSQSKMLNLFMLFLKKRIDIKSIKMEEESRSNLEEFGQLREGAIIYDKIWKKSQFFGNWEERYVVIKKEGLYSYRGLKAKPTMQIPLTQITEISTFFEFYKQQLVVKLFYNGTKTDFGLPLDSKLQWLTSFIDLMGLEGL